MGSNAWVNIEGDSLAAQCMVRRKDLGSTGERLEGAGSTQ